MGPDSSRSLRPGETKYGCVSIPRSLRRYIPVTLTHDTLGNREVRFKNQIRAYKYDRSQGSAGWTPRRKRRHPSA